LKACTYDFKGGAKTSTEHIPDITKMPDYIPLNLEGKKSPFMAQNGKMLFLRNPIKVNSKKTKAE